MTFSSWFHRFRSDKSSNFNFMDNFHRDFHQFLDFSGSLHHFNNIFKTSCHSSDIIFEFLGHFLQFSSISLDFSPILRELYNFIFIISSIFCRIYLHLRDYFPPILLFCYFIYWIFIIGGFPQSIRYVWISLVSFSSRNFAGKFSDCKIFLRDFQEFFS